MDDSAGEAGGQSQVHVCSSYPLSFPSQPPDIKNWFSSYVYDSPEVPELVADYDGGNGSETQDPFEHSSLKHSLQDGGVTLGENCFGGQSEPEIFSGKYVVPVDGNAMKPAPRRKQSLRALFGASFLDEAEEANETDSHGLFPVQLNALKHASDCTSVPLLNEICEAHSEKKDCTTSLPDSTRHSQEGTIIEHSKVLVNCDRISSADTQESTPADQEVESKKSTNCDDGRLADIGKGFAEDVINHIELPVSFNSTILVGTEKKIQDGVDNSTSLVSRNSLSLADTEDNSPLGETGNEENSPIGGIDCCKLSLDSKRRQEIVASDGFIAIKRKAKQPEEHKTNKILRHPIGREKEKGNLKENGIIPNQKVLVQEQTRRPLTDRTNFSEINASPVPEPSRKWKCPRKGKPYVGRPMKQLRLEQWVRRVN